MVAQRLAAGDAGLVPPGLSGGNDADIATIADRAVIDFLRERHKGTHPIAFGRQLQEWAMTSGIHWGALGVGSLAAVTEPAREAPERNTPEAAASGDARS
jgi:hypothetical protein